MTSTSTCAALDPDCFTAQRLSNATPEHLYITSRRCFIGPIPEGWLKSHRRDWYKHHLHLNYSSRAASFHADPNVSRQRQLSGLEGPSTSAAYRQTFRQPDDVSESNQAEDVEPSRASEPDSEVTQVDRRVQDEEDILEGSRPLDEDTPQMSDGAASDEREGVPRNENEDVGNESQQDARLSPDNGNGLKIPPRDPYAEGREGSASRIVSMDESQLGVGTSGPGSNKAESTRSLLEHKDPSPAQGADAEEPVRSDSEGLLSRIVRPPRNDDDADEDSGAAGGENARRKSALVSFAVPEDSRRADLLYKARATQINLQRSASGLLRGSTRDGQIIKMEKMLVRVDVSPEKKLPDDYDENESQGIISRTTEKWKEFMVVCRESTDDEADFVLQMYNTRVIPAIHDPKATKRTKYEILLDKKSSHVNLYSSLDKSVVIWVPYARGTTIYILRPRSSANSVEWYTFLRNILGWRRAQELTVNVPDLSITLRLKDPFKELEDLGADALDKDAIKKTMDQEHAVASKVIQRCLQMLQKDPGWSEIVQIWAIRDHVGLAWKRYDRLEWIHGANERKMYGTIAMMKSHELELRPKSHSPTMAHTRKGKSLTEPAPVEGFLIRLTSQKGAHQKMGKLFFKRLYFSSHNQYLVFSRPAKAYPPPPPTLPTSPNPDGPSAHEIAQKMPLIYAVNPYPVQDGRIKWLAGGQHTKANVRERDDDAHDEAERNLNVVLDCDGYIDMCDIKKVRNIHRGATPADDNIDQGSDVDFDEEVDDTTSEDGTTTHLEDERCFELLLQNGLVIRLQAFDKTTKKEWKKRLRHLVRYWRYRTSEEMDFYKVVRKQNLEELRIDEDAEATMGQFAKKWEVTQTYASPELYNLCGISCCRTIHMSGSLYRKPRLHSSFTLASVLLVPGHLLIFSPRLRSRTGKNIPTIHHERQSALGLDLTQCYLYSGLLTENELLYTNNTFDSNRPGRSGLHRWYADDTWRVSDEDVMCTFVLWYQRRKEWLRVPGSSAVKALAARTSDDAGEEHARPISKNRQRRDSEASEREGGSGSTRARLKRVSQLGVKGRSIVFKARSRAERDRWVLALSTEIDRLAGAEDVRLTTKK